MSRHQAFRNVQNTVEEHVYHDDDYSDEEDELSAEDKALMEQGTADVRAALGVEASKVTTAQIQEALWHYYYDVDKSVTYLLTKFIAPPPPKSAKSSQQGKPSGKHMFSCLATALSRSISQLRPKGRAYSKSQE
jgi:elongation factor 1 alpha-like protein